jgi:outer membrane protein assembly factor BamA
MVSFACNLKNRIKYFFSSRFFIPCFALFAILASSCSITKNVPEGQYLLDKVEVKVESTDKKSIKDVELQRYIRQQPNKRILLFRFHLRLYNAAKPNKTKGLSKFFRTIGEEPVLLDTFLTQQSSINVKRYLDSKGFYNSVVENSTNYSKRKAKVSYTINLGLPYMVSNVKYIIEDTLIRRIVLSDSLNKVITTGVRFDLDLLKEERIRIEKLLKEDGYYFFSRDYITFNADTSAGVRKTNLELTIRNRFLRNQFGERIPQTFKKYEISNVFIYPNYDPVRFYQYLQSKQLDTLSFDGQNIVYHVSPGIKPKTITNANLIIPGQQYSESTVKTTKNNFNALRLYRIVNIFFEEDMQAEAKATDDDAFVFFNDEKKDEETRLGRLICHIQLTPHTLQSYQIDLVGTNSTSDIGVEGNLNYQHKNIFRGAETFDIKLRGMVEILSSERSGLSQSVEYGGAVSFGFPRFLNPFFSQGLLGKYNPRTQVSTSYSYQERPEYTRTVAGLNFGYNWRGEKKFSHTIIPSEISVINIFSISPSFYEIIKDTYLENSYKNQLVTLSSYSMIYNNQLSPRESFSLVRLNFEVSGNILNSLFSVIGEKSDDDTYKIFDISFSQFVRGDINYAYNHLVDEKNTFVYRIYAGAGLPYGNSKALPFEKKYFSGGSTGVRAWHARGLGPGSYVEQQLSIPNQTADIKIEANVEYRFKLVWLLEGALFVDAGNIWAISRADERPGALFEFNNFYKQIALGTGLGIRMDLGFFALRFDMGVKVHDPGIVIPLEGEEPAINYHWIPFDRPYNFGDDFVYHFGIGYPF